MNLNINPTLLSSLNDDELQILAQVEESEDLSQIPTELLNKISGNIEYNTFAETIRSLAGAASFEFADEIESSIMSLGLPENESYDTYKSELALQAAKFKMDHPNVALTAEVIGSIVPLVASIYTGGATAPAALARPISAIKNVINLIPRGARQPFSAFKQMLTKTPTRSAITTGAIGGGLYGVGSGEGSLGNRLGGSIEDVVIGAVFAEPFRKFGNLFLQAPNYLRANNQQQFTLPILRQMKDDAYQSVRDLGIQMNSAITTPLAQNLSNLIENYTFSGRIPQNIRNIQSYIDNIDGQTIGFDRLERLRGDILSQLADEGATNYRDNILIRNMAKSIDDFMQIELPKVLPAPQAKIIEDARLANRTYNQYRELERAMRRARLGRGNSYGERIQDEIRNVLLSDDVSWQFNPEQISALENFVTQRNIGEKIGILFGGRQAALGGAPTGVSASLQSPLRISQTESLLQRIGAGVPLSPVQPEGWSGLLGPRGPFGGPRPLLSQREGTEEQAALLAIQNPYNQ